MKAPRWPTSLRWRLLALLFTAVLCTALAQATLAYRSALAEADALFDDQSCKRLVIDLCPGIALACAVVLCFLHFRGLDQQRLDFLIHENQQFVSGVVRFDWRILKATTVMCADPERRSQGGTLEASSLFLPNCASHRT